jgi:hypothetical protein
MALRSLRSREVSSRAHIAPRRVGPGAKGKIRGAKQEKQREFFEEINSRAAKEVRRGEVIGRTRAELIKLTDYLYIISSERVQHQLSHIRMQLTSY